MSASMMYRLAAHSYFKQSAVEKIAQLYLALPSSAARLQLSEPVQRNAVSESLTVWIFLFFFGAGIFSQICPHHGGRVGKRKITSSKSRKDYTNAHARYLLRDKSFTCTEYFVQYAFL